MFVATLPTAKSPNVNGSGLTEGVMSRLRFDLDRLGCKSRVTALSGGESPKCTHREAFLSSATNVVAVRWALGSEPSGIRVSRSKCA